MANPHTDEQETLWTDRRHILWFPWTFDVYRVANGRIYCRKGLFNQEENECMIYRVLDISLKRTLLNRICGTGSVILRTKDASDSILTLKNIRNSQQVKDMQRAGGAGPPRQRPAGPRDVRRRRRPHGRRLPRRQRRGMTAPPKPQREEDPQ